MNAVHSCRRNVALLACALASAMAWGADPAASEVQRNLQLRQQQQDELQLRMQQHQKSSQTPPADARQQRSVHQLEIEQRQRQQQLHDQQNVEKQPAPTTDDEGAQRAKAQIEQQRMQQEGQRQLRRFDWELEQRSKAPTGSAVSDGRTPPANGAGVGEAGTAQQRR